MAEQKHNRFSMFTHRMKEKMGLAEKTIDNLTIKDESYRVDVLSEQMKKISKHVLKMVNSIQALAETGDHLATKMTDGHVTFRDDEDRTLLSGCLERTSEFEKAMEDLRCKMSQSINSEIHGSIKNILDTEIKEAKIQRNLYEGVKVDLSNAQTRVNSAQKSKNQEKIDICTQELEETKNRYDEIERTTFLTLRDSISVSEYKLLESLIKYVENQRQFYDRGYQMLNEMTLDIYEYRNHADIQKSKIQQSSEAKQRMTRIIEPVQQHVSKDKIFGVSLKDINTSGRSKDGVPVIFLTYVKMIEEHGLEEEGLFRVNASKFDLEKFKTLADTNKPFTFEPYHSLLAADLIKRFLRDMPDPLLSREYANDFVSVLDIENEGARIERLQSIIQRLPRENILTFKTLLGLMYLISLHSKANKMNSMALATCIAPNILVPIIGPDVDPFELTAQTISVISFMIQNNNEIFENLQIPDDVELDNPETAVVHSEPTPEDTVIDVPEMPIAPPETPKLTITPIIYDPQSAPTNIRKPENPPRNTSVAPSKIAPPDSPKPTISPLTRPDQTLLKKHSTRTINLNQPMPPSRTVPKKPIPPPRIKKTSDGPSDAVVTAPPTVVSEPVEQQSPVEVEPEVSETPSDQNLFVVDANMLNYHPVEKVEDEVEEKEEKQLLLPSIESLHTE